MNKVQKPNFLALTIANILFCIVLLLIASFLTFKYNLNIDVVLSFCILLFTGIYSGKQTCKATPNKKLIHAFFASTLFFSLYLIACFIQKGENSPYFTYILCAFNIYLGTFIGCMLSANEKKRKGR